MQHPHRRGSIVPHIIGGFIMGGLFLAGQYFFTAHNAGAAEILSVYQSIANYDASENNVSPDDDDAIDYPDGEGAIDSNLVTDYPASVEATEQEEFSDWFASLAPYERDWKCTISVVDFVGTQTDYFLIGHTLAEIERSLVGFMIPNQRVEGGHRYRENRAMQNRSDAVCRNSRGDEAIFAGTEGFTPTADITSRLQRLGLIPSQP